MSAAGRHLQAAGSDRDVLPDDAATDAFLARYVEWREACVEVRCTGRRWSAAAPADRRTAFVVHRASLEREAAAAFAYARASEEIRSVGSRLAAAAPWHPRPPEGTLACPGPDQGVHRCDGRPSSGGSLHPPSGGHHG